MPDTVKSKVAIDSSIDQSIPKVVVAQPPAEEAEESDVSQNRPYPIVQRISNFFMDFLETIVVALSIFVVVYLFLVQPHEVKGSSMEPNFQNNDYILTDKISLKLHEPSRGDVVIFKAPRNPDVDYIKRIIGLPGERVKILGGAVYINGLRLSEPYLTSSTNLFPGSFLQEGVEITVPEGEYFVMGDNRSHSSDSREFGPIPQSLIIGKAIFRYWPIVKGGLISKISY
ncbi:signal peptidase I [Candidatus Gottesmanbacteria bacterium]|nr:signal peptidase I [Candidatus Gottesmanbacteria bacterium]MBI5452136.1 signal peptidase I [Candidatus Gottesmanbacteria bacterium]